MREERKHIDNVINAINVDNVININKHKGVNTMSCTIWTNTRTEDQLREIGFIIPNHPKTGDCFLDGRKIGYMDNFTGLILRDKKALQHIKRRLPNLGIWNEKDLLDA